MSETKIKPCPFCGGKAYLERSHRAFTPYEQQQAFSDETVYEDNYYCCCRIEEAIDLGNGEWLLGLRILDEDLENTRAIEYFKLSEIRLSLIDDDQEGEDGDL